MAFVHPLVARVFHSELTKVMLCRYDWVKTCGLAAYLCRSIDSVMCSKGAIGTVRTDDFRKDAVRIALTSGLSRKQLAEVFGVGMSTLNKWITAHRDTDVVSQEDRELALENERLRRENCILREEREVLNNRPGPLPARARYKQPMLCSTAGG